jgi:hypothetical protein
MTTESEEAELRQSLYATDLRTADPDTMVYVRPGVWKRWAELTRVDLKDRDAEWKRLLLIETDSAAEAMSVVTIDRDD